MSGLLCAAGLFAVLHFAHAQTTPDTGSAVTTDPDADVSNLSDLEVELKALELATPLAASNVPATGNFYSAQHAPGSATPWPPFPGNIFLLSAWPLDTNIFVLDDLNFDYNDASVKTSKTAASMVAKTDLEGPPTPPGSGGSNTNSPSPQANEMPDFGTNLYFSQFGMVSNTLTGTATNTLADVEYAIQTNADLTSTNWADNGQFILGSEVTNWTQFILPPPHSTNNLFFRLQSWASADGSGLPTWWESEYFGTNTVDPYADPTGDGWTLLEDFEYGWNPSVFRTPPAPQGVTVNYNTTNGTAIISWLPSSGAVTGYTIRDSDGNTFNVSANTTSFTDTVTDQPDPNNNWNIATTYTVQADYADGDSTVSGAVPLESAPFSVAIVPGPNGTAYLAVAAFPPNAANIQLTEIDMYAYEFIGGNGLVTNYDIPVGDFTNGLYPLPNKLVPSDGNFRGTWRYNWYAQAKGTNGYGLTATTWLLEDYCSPQDGYFNSWLVPPFFDGREQLKQNLIFQLRAAVADRPFQYTEISSGGPVAISSPTNYAFAGYYMYSDRGYEDPFDPVLDTFLPFEENYFDRNFVYDSSYLDANGRTTTGVGGNYDDGGGLTISTPYGLVDYLEIPGPFEFVAPTNNDVPIASVLATNQTRWLATYALDSGISYLGLIGISLSEDESFYTMTNGFPNYFGLTNLSAEVVWGNGGGDSTTLSAGSSIENNGGYFYPETAQPKFKTVGYDFWIAPQSLYYYSYSYDDFPSVMGMSNTHTNPVLIVGVGQSGFQVAGYAKLEVTNSAYSGVYGYLGQYFTNAFEINTNGDITTNLTGVVSPYGGFFPTQPGPVALKTMPDPETGEQGTGIVNCISLNVDKNHDGTMDLSFNGPDATSQASPMEFWVNNDNDGTGVGSEIEVDSTNDYDYKTGYIGSERGLEDFARLWICGVPAITFSNGLSATLSCTVISGSPAINVYEAGTNVGMLYLTATNVAQSLVSERPLGSVGVNTPGSGTLIFSSDFFDGSNKYLLFEGAGIGEGQFTLTIYQGTTVIAQTSTYIDLHDVDDFFERTVITNSIIGTVSTNWHGEIETEQSAIVPNALGNDTNLIVFVHGFNTEDWKWLNSSETTYKRLYWAGYRGQLATVKWPCQTFDPLLFDLSEEDAYKASTALITYLEQLRTRYPGYRLNLLVHSQGNAFVSEAIKNGAPFDTYILTQGAVAASAYDVNAPTNTLLLDSEIGHPTPDWQPMGYHGVYTNITTGRLINFYNTNDFVLAGWADGQAFKPDDDYGSDGTNVWEYVTGAPNMPITDSQVSRAFVARSRTDAIGAQGLGSGESKQGVMGTTFDLGANFGFGNTKAEHSAEWRRPIQTCLPYFQQVLVQIKSPQ